MNLYDVKKMYKNLFESGMVMLPPKMREQIMRDAPRDFPLLNKCKFLKQDSFTNKEYLSPATIKLFVSLKATLIALAEFIDEKLQQSTEYTPAEPPTPMPIGHAKEFINNLRDKLNRNKEMIARKIFYDNLKNGQKLDESQIKKALVKNIFEDAYPYMKNITHLQKADKIAAKMLYEQTIEKISNLI